MISVDVRKELRGYGGRHVLAIDTSFPAGSITQLYGPSGCGKTTFLKIFAGLIRPECGHIVFGDATWLDTSKNINVPAQERKTGFVFQDYALFPHMTVARHLQFAGADREWSERLLRAGKLDTMPDRRPKQLSGGQQQRLAILRAMATKPKLLLMDEPFSALDQRTKSSLISELKGLWKELGTTVLVATHSTVELQGLSETVLEICGDT